MCNHEANKPVKNGREAEPGVGERMPGVVVKRGRCTKVEKRVEVGEVYAFPEFGGKSYRNVPGGGEEVRNGTWSRLRGLIDFEAVERANARSRREAERMRGGAREGGRGVPPAR